MCVHKEGTCCFPGSRKVVRIGERGGVAAAALLQGGMLLTWIWATFLQPSHLISYATAPWDAKACFC
eukprot:1157853-Pelagomonas_calceolata.AAC.4